MKLATSAVVLVAAIFVLLAVCDAVTIGEKKTYVTQRKQTFSFKVHK